MPSNGWGPGWPGGATGPVVVAVTGARQLRLPVRVEIVPLVAGLVADLEAARGGEAFRPDWSWGYANRPIAGTTTPSNHSRATAVDLDAPVNPYLTAAEHRRAHPLRKTFPGGRLLRSTMPLDVETIAGRWGFRWGGTYVSKPDPMHFELNLTPRGVAALIADLRALDGRPVPEHPWPFEETPVQPSDVVQVLPLGDRWQELGGVDDQAHYVLLADGTIEHHGTVDRGDYTRLKSEHQLPIDPRFVQIQLGDRYGRLGRGVDYTEFAHTGQPYQFGPGSKPLLRD